MITALIIAKTQIGLRLDATEGVSAGTTLAYIGFIHGPTFVMRTESSIGTMTIEMHHIAWNDGSIIIQHTGTTVGIQVAYQIIEGWRVQAVEKYLTILK